MASLNNRKKAKPALRSQIKDSENSPRKIIRPPKKGKSKREENRPNPPNKSSGGTLGEGKNKGVLQEITNPTSKGKPMEELEELEEKNTFP